MKPNAGGELRGKRASVLPVSSTGLFGWGRPYARLFEHFVCQDKEVRGYRDPQGLGRLQVKHLGKSNLVF